MRKHLKIFVWIAAAMFGFVPVQAQQLDELSRCVDYLEQSFWRGMLSGQESAARRKLEELVMQLQLKASAVQRRRGGMAQRVYGNPTIQASQFKYLVAGNRNVKNLLRSVPRIKLTNASQFRQYSSRQRRNNKTHLSPGGEEAMYTLFIEETCNENLDSATRRFSTSSELSRPQIANFSRIAELFYRAIGDMRICIYRLRRGERVFIRR